jgi:hypothetical protein
MISSAWTPVYKFVFPAILLAGFLGFPVLSGEPWIWWGLASPVMLLSLVLYYLFLAPLKVVRTDDEAFFVSNYRREVRIPFSQVDKITDNPRLNTKAITIHVRTKTEFGRKVIFMPTVDLSSFMSGHPMADELRDLVRRDQVQT